MRESWDMRASRWKTGRVLAMLLEYREISSMVGSSVLFQTHLEWWFRFVVRLL